MKTTIEKGSWSTSYKSKIEDFLIVNTNTKRNRLGRIAYSIQRIDAVCALLMIFVFAELHLGAFESLVAKHEILQPMTRK